uniref:Gustatory receptor n=1 Tax=Globodera rostochiensis TaxID=31243 RepID=A0A914GS09_GLORO
MQIAFGSVGFGVFNLFVQYINVAFPRKQNEMRNTVFIALRYTSIVQNCYVATLSLYGSTKQSFLITTIVVATFLCFVGVCIIAWAFYNRCKWCRKFGLKQQLKQINRNFRHILVVYFGIFGGLYHFVGIDNLLAPFIAVVSSLLYALVYYCIAKNSIGEEYSKAPIRGQAPDSDDYIQQMLNAGLEKGGDGAEQHESLLVWLLLKECEIVENILDNELKVEVGRNCTALKSGKPLNSQNGPKMVAYLKRIEKEKQITVDGQQFVALFNILRQLVKEMSAGPAKDAIEAVFKQKLVPMPPSEMLQFAIQIWHIHSNNVHGHPQKRREHPRRRRKRANGESLLINSLAFIVVWFITSKLIIGSVKSGLSAIDETFKEYFYRIVFGIAIILFFLFQNAQNGQGQSFQRAIQSILSKLKNRRRH